MDLMSVLKTQWDRSLAVALSLLGGLALLLGYIGVSGEALLARQMPYIISGGLTGIFLLGLAATLWLSADLRDEWRELHIAREMLEEWPSVSRDDLTDELATDVLSHDDVTPAKTKTQARRRAVRPA